MIDNVVKQDGIGLFFSRGLHRPTGNAREFPVLVHRCAHVPQTARLLEKDEKRFQIQKRGLWARGHTNTSPPSTTSVCPVMKSLSCEAKKEIVPSKSSGVPVLARARKAIT